VTKRVIAIGAVVGLVLAAVLYFVNERSRLAAMDDSLASFVATPAFTDVRDRCRTDPAKLGPIPAPDRDAAAIDVFAYDGELHPVDANAPAFSTDLADSMRGKLSAFGRFRSPEGNGVEVGIATPWRNGNCALILARLAPRPGEVLTEEIRTGGIAAAVAIAIWIGGSFLSRKARK